MRSMLSVSALLWGAVLLVATGVHAQRRPVSPPPVPPTPEVAPVEAPPAAVESDPAQLDDAAARQHFESGRAYFQRAQYDEAAREFAEAYRLSARPALLINLSRSEEGAGRLEAAVEALRQWEGIAAADDPERPAMAERAQRLRAAIERARAAAARPPPPPAPRETGLTGMQLVGVVLLSGGAAVGVGALITGIMAASTHAELESACDPSGGCPPDHVDDINRGESLALVSTVLSGLALAAGATGLVLLLTQGRDDEHAPAAAPSTAPSARLVPGPGQLGAGVAWSF